MTVTDPRPETTPAQPTTEPKRARGSRSTARPPPRPLDRQLEPENATQWAREGKAIASRNLRWSIFAEFLGFVVWQLWSVVVVSLPAAGFQLSTGEIFWLNLHAEPGGRDAAHPLHVHGPRFGGGRNWTIVSAGLLLIPSIGLAIAVSNPAPFGLLLLIAAFAGFGGGNFASSMANITYFYRPRRRVTPSDSTPPAATSAPRSRSSSFRSSSRSAPRRP